MSIMIYDFKKGQICVLLLHIISNLNMFVNVRGELTQTDHVCPSQTLIVPSELIRRMEIHDNDDIGDLNNDGVIDDEDVRVLVDDYYQDLNNEDIEIIIEEYDFSGCVTTSCYWGKGMYYESIKMWFQNLVRF